MLDQILTLYDALPVTDPWRGPIHPHVGSAYTSTGAPMLRLMGVGVNAYAAADDRPAGGVWPDGYLRQRWKFQKQVRRDLAVIGAALVGLPVHGGSSYADPASVYLTNAVKRWLPESEGKSSASVDDHWLEEGSEVLRRELDVLADMGRLPHAVVVFGDRPWTHVWPVFGRAPRPDWVADYQPMSADLFDGIVTGPLFHHLNRVVVREDGRERPLFLMKVRHPAARRRGMTPTALVGHPGFAAVTAR